jgi:tetratricopeptide (TPR) repeat protein
LDTIEPAKTSKALTLAGKKNSLALLRPVYNLSPFLRLLFFYLSITLVSFFSTYLAINLTLSMAVIVAAAVLFLFPDICAALSVHYILRGKVRPAVKLCDTAYTLAPDNYNVLVNNAFAYLRIGELEEAKAFADKAIARGPRKAIAYINRAATLFAMGDYRGAEADAVKAIELKPRDVRGHVNRVSALMGQCRFREALLELDKMEHHRQYRDLINYNRLVCRLNMAQVEEAEQEWKRTTCKNKILLGYGKASISWEKGDFEDVLLETTQVRDDSLDAGAFLYMRALAYSALGETEMAYRVAAQLLWEKPQSVWGLRALLCVLSDCGYGEKILIQDACDRLERRSQYFLEPHFKRALIYLEEENYAQVQEQAEKALAICETSSEGKALKAIALARLGMAQEAMQLAKQITRQVHSRPLCFIALSEAQLASGLADEAIVSAKKATAIGRYYPLYYKCLARTYMSLDREDEARAMLSEAKRLRDACRTGVDRAQADFPLSVLLGEADHGGESGCVLTFC